MAAGREKANYSRLSTSESQQKQKHNHNHKVSLHWKCFCYPTNCSPLINFLTEQKCMQCMHRWWLGIYWEVWSVALGIDQYLKLTVPGPPISVWCCMLQPWFDYKRYCRKKEEKNACIFRTAAAEGVFLAESSVSIFALVWNFQESFILK